jgi:hypothetical protein
MISCLCSLKGHTHPCIFPSFWFTMKPKIVLFLSYKTSFTPLLLFEVFFACVRHHYWGKKKFNEVYNYIIMYGLQTNIHLLKGRTSDLELALQQLAKIIQTLGHARQNNAGISQCRTDRYSHPWTKDFKDTNL